MWTQKYRPKSLKEFAGNEAEVNEILNWLRNWKKEKKKALLVSGPPGCGKTTIVQLLAKEFGYNLIDTNASDKRGAKSLKEEFGSSLQQHSLFYKGKLVLFDEVEGLSGTEDRGAVKEIAAMIETTKHPIILITNDFSKPNLRSIKKYCKSIKFGKVHINTVEKLLKKICDSESIKIDEKALKFLSRSADGDLKAAINDLQSVSGEKNELTYEHVETIGYRDAEKSVFESLMIIFKTMNAQTANEAISNMEKDPDEVLEWVRENIPLEYTKVEDLSRAYDALSRADVFRGRIRKQQYWAFLHYMLQMISVGVALSKDEKYHEFVKYQYPSKIAQLGRTKMLRAQQKEFLEKLGAELHCSTRIARAYLPLLEIMREYRSEDYKCIHNKLGVIIV